MYASQADLAKFITSPCLDSPAYVHKEVVCKHLFTENASLFWILKNKYLGFLEVIKALAVLLISIGQVGYIIVNK